MANDTTTNGPKRQSWRCFLCIGAVMGLCTVRLASDMKSLGLSGNYSAIIRYHQRAVRQASAMFHMEPTEDTTQRTREERQEKTEESRKRDRQADKVKPKKSTTVVTTQVSPFSQADISKTVQHFGGFPIRLLVFDGENFGGYNLVSIEREASSPKYQSSWCRRCGALVPMMVDALRRHFPERFVRGSPPFQIAFSTNDCINTKCVNYPDKCDTASFAPIVSFGTVTKDPEILPSVQAFPLHFFDMCMFNWLAPQLQQRQNCKFPTKAPATTPWEQLIPQIIWRGTDYRFSMIFKKYAKLQRGKDLLTGSNLTAANAAEILLKEWDNLTPRWRALGLSLKAEAETSGKKQLPWLDCKFVGTKSRTFDPSNAGTALVTADRMGIDEMAQYKYQIDIGGVGGTTWLGTVNKLAMPGLLFHHETNMKDWFYDDIKPWVHYVPVKIDFGDLHEKYKWAEANPAKAEKISKAATKFALNMMSKQYMDATYKKYFVETLGSIMDAYQPKKKESIESVIKGYEADGYEVHQFSECGETSCIIRTRPDRGCNHSLPLGNDAVVEEKDTTLSFYSTPTNTQHSVKQES